MVIILQQELKAADLAIPPVVSVSVIQIKEVSVSGDDDTLAALAYTVVSSK